MNSQPNEDLQRRLQQLEEEIKSPSVNDYPTEDKTELIPILGKWKLYLEKSRNWFNGLSSIKKVLFTSVVLLLTVWILQTVFKLVISTITLLVLAGLVYLGYKFFISSSFQNKQ